MKILNKRQTKKLLELIEKQFKTNIELDCYIRAVENKFYIVTKDIAKINPSELNIKSAGLYLGKIEKEKFIPSKEAAQMFDLPVSQI